MISFVIRKKMDQVKADSLYREYLNAEKIRRQLKVLR